MSSSAEWVRLAAAQAERKLKEGDRAAEFMEKVKRQQQQAGAKQQQQPVQVGWVDVCAVCVLIVCRVCVWVNVCVGCVCVWGGGACCVTVLWGRTCCFFCDALTYVCVCC